MNYLTDTFIGTAPGIWFGLITVSILWAFGMASVRISKFSIGVKPKKLIFNVAGYKMLWNPTVKRKLKHPN